MAESMETSSTGGSRARDDIGMAMSERPTCILCLGMAGSGKTTFVQVETPDIICDGRTVTFIGGLQPEATFFPTHAETECSPALEEQSSLHHQP